MTALCRVCGKTFKTDKGLHLHISKAHKIPLPEYYVNFYQRKDKFNNKLLSYKNKDDYFNIDFRTRSNLIAWSKRAKKEEVKDYILGQLRRRVEAKGLKYGPSHLELELHDLPPLDMYKEFFGSYSKACDELKIKPLFEKNIMTDFFTEDTELSSIKILVDTREQQPLRFSKSLSMKLDFGDYAVGAPHYDYTYVDRKSESDFKSTMTTGFKRFTRELERAQQFDAYLFVAVESSIEKIKKNNIFGPHRSNMPYIWHNMRVLTHMFPRKCQFIFTGNRTASEAIVPKLLVYGKKLWETDLQYFIDKS